LIKHLKYNEIDTDKWDYCILKSVNSLPYAYAWYLDIIHEEWEALVEDDYERVMPLPVSKKYGITYCYQPFFAQQLGVFSKNEINPEIVDKFIDSIPKDIKVVNYNLNHFNTIDSKEYHINNNNNYLLDLISDYDKIYNSYSTNTKRNLKKSNKNDLVKLKGVKPEDIIELFRDNKGKDVGKWTEEHYLILKRLMYVCIYKGVGVSYGIYSDSNELCTAAFFLKTPNRLVFLFSGNSMLGKELGGMPFLIDEIIKENSPGFRILDFEGSNDPNLARFYKGFGAVKSVYQNIQINKLNTILKTLLKFTGR